VPATVTAATSSDARGYRRRASNSGGRWPAASWSRSGWVSSAPRRIHSPTSAITAPTANGTRQPHAVISGLESVAASTAASPDATSWPRVVDTYWKLENSPRRPGGADSTRNVVDAANSPPIDRPCSRRANTRRAGATRPALA
jgi:hypothetical protein